jgi:hypothetical protein
MMIVTVIVPALKFQRLHETTHPHIPLFTNAGKVSRESAGRWRSNSGLLFGFDKSQQREMTKRRHRPTLDQAHVLSPFDPAGESAPRKLQPLSEPTNDRLQ